MSQLSTPAVVSQSNAGSLASGVSVEKLTWKIRLTDYVELSKARIAVMVLVTVTIGFLLASKGQFDWGLLGHSLFGIALIAAASSALNQVYEKRTDALMPRTKNRPLPTGRITRWQAIFFAIVTAVYGSVHLVLFVNTLTMLLTVGTLIMYVLIYTPLKRRTFLCTSIGAIPGAFPPLLGWAATGQPMGWDVFWLFSLMFLWQFPHFFAIAWIYREQYDSAGLKMLPGGIPAKYTTGLLAVIYALILLPVSLMPQQFGIAGQVYFWVTFAFGVAYLGYSIRFMLNECRETARGLLFCSLFYLPVVLATLTWNHLSLLHSQKPESTVSVVAEKIENNLES